MVKLISTNLEWENSLLTYSLWFKSLFCGFLVGIIFLTIAPLGLAISFIESLKPVLAPGTYLSELILGGSSGLLYFIITIAGNGLIYTAAFFILFLARKKN